MHPTAAKVQERLSERGLDVEVVDLPDSTRTADLALLRYSERPGVPPTTQTPGRSAWPLTD